MTLCCFAYLAFVGKGRVRGDFDIAMFQRIGALRSKIGISSLEPGAKKSPDSNQGFGFVGFWRFLPWDLAKNAEIALFQRMN